MLCLLHVHSHHTTLKLEDEVFTDERLYAQQEGGALRRLQEAIELVLPAECEEESEGVISGLPLFAGVGAHLNRPHPLDLVEQQEAGYDLFDRGV